MSTPRDRIEAKLGLTGPQLCHLRDGPPPIPDHELIRRIGRGAYGEVWLARNALGTWRAIKIVYRDNFKDARPYEREFAGIRRFEPLSRSNEGFVDILQAGRDEGGGWFYYVMELADDAGKPGAEGEGPRPEGNLDPESYIPHTLSWNLHHHGRLPLAQCLELGLTLSFALGHLHRHGLIHRDIKPSNIIFVGGVPKLADIGLVTEAEGANTFVGTEGFIPPEGPTSPQADIYALGKVLYEAAMGKDRNEFPEPFSQIGTDQESVALMELNAVLLRACAPDPKARYASAEEMHADLALLHSGGSVQRRHKFERRFLVAQRVGAVVAVAALVAVAAWFWQHRQTGKMTRLAMEKAALATEKTKLADNLARIVEENRERIVRFDVANGIRLLDQGDPSAALLWFADALPLVTNKPAEEVIHRIRIQQALDQTPRVLRVLPHESTLNCSAFSPDGQFVVTGTQDGSLQVWNVVDGALVWGPKRMMAEVNFVRFSRDGKRVFACSSPQQGMFNGWLPARACMAVLDAKSGRKLFPDDETWAGMAANLSCSHFSPDDRWLAVSQKGNVIRVFDLRDGRQVTEIRGHTDEVPFLSFSANGSLLASASLDRTVRLWRLPTGEPAGPPLEHRWPVLRVLLTDDGQRLITGSFAKPGANGPGEDAESEVQAWDVPNCRRLGDPIPTGGWPAMFVAPALQGRFFVQGVKGGEGIQAYNFESTTKPAARLDMDALHSWDFSKDGRRLALGGGDYTARVFDAWTGKPVSELFRHGHWGVLNIQFSLDDHQLLTASNDGNARLWDLRATPSDSARQILPSPLRKLSAEVFGWRMGWPSALTEVLLQDGTVQIIGDQLQELHRFTPPATGTEILKLASAHRAGMWSFRYDAGTNDSAALILRREDGGKILQFSLEHPDAVMGCNFTPDDRYLVTLCRDRVVRFWRTSDGGLERTVVIPRAGDGDIVNPDPDGAAERDRRPPRHLTRTGEIVAIGPDCRTAIWAGVAELGVPLPRLVRSLDLETGEFIGPVLELPSTISGSAFSQDGSQVAYMDSLGPVTVVEVRTARVVSSTIRHSSNLLWVGWDPEGRRLLTTGPNDEVLVWDAKAGAQVLGPLRTPGGIVRIARWSPDGRFIVTRSDDKTVRIWDAATGEAVTSALKHSGDVAFALMTRNNRVITASYPDQLRAWDLKETSLPPDLLAGYAKLLSGRYLNSGGVMLVLKPEALAELDRSVRTRAPQLFAAP